MNPTVRFAVSVFVLIFGLSLSGCDTDTPPETDILTLGSEDTAGAGTDTKADALPSRHKSCKTGVAYGHHSMADMGALSPGVSWWYNRYFAPDSEMYKAAFTLPSWLTEFACSDSPSFAAQKGFLQDAVAYLENEPRIERHAWSAGRADNVTSANRPNDDIKGQIIGQEGLS
jgi:hypothetical protein